MPHDDSSALVATRPPSVVPRPPCAAPAAFSSVSAYRFWLTFISTVAISRSAGDCDCASTRRASGAGRSPRSSASTAPPGTSMPRAKTLVVKGVVIPDDCAIDACNPGGLQRAGPFVEHSGRAFVATVDGGIARAPDDQVTLQHAAFDGRAGLQRRGEAEVPPER